MNELGDRRPALLAVDAGAIRVQRALAKLIAAENPAQSTNGKHAAGARS
jgi:hypothetical protein